MPNLINNDTVNNITYLNYFDSLTNGVINTNTGTSSINVRDACIARWGANSAISNSSSYPLGIWGFPNSPNEMKTNRTASTSNYRIAFSPISFTKGNGLARARLNSNTSTGTTINAVMPTQTGSYTPVAPYYEYAIITNNNISCAGFKANGTNLNTAEWCFVSAGWLADSVFGSSIAVRGLYEIQLSYVGSGASRVSVEGQTTVQNLLISGDAQYPITCLSNTGDGTTPAANLWATDLWLRDDPSGYAIGRIPHVLLCKTTTLSLGQLVKINTTIDGITDQKIWLVAANYGSDKLLMRVYTEGIS